MPITSDSCNKCDCDLQSSGPALRNCNHCGAMFCLICSQELVRSHICPECGKSPSDSYDSLTSLPSPAA